MNDFIKRKKEWMEGEREGANMKNRNIQKEKEDSTNIIGKERGTEGGRQEGIKQRDDRERGKRGRMRERKKIRELKKE